MHMTSLLMNTTMKDLKPMFYNWKKALKNMGLKVSIIKTKVIIAGHKKNC